jgi:DNA polymerase III alpha subunit
VIHCHGHSGFSALDGLGSPTHRAQVAARHGQAGLALTDHGTVGGLLAHRKACRENGIIPVAGVEAYFRPDRLTREKEWRYRRWHVILLAKNLVGWHNLIRITSASYGDGYYQSPCVDWDLFERYHEGLIMTTSCTLGPLSYLVQNGTDAQVDDWMQRAKNIFGDDLWVSIMPHDIPVQQIYNLEAVSIANKHGVGIVHEKDSHYPEKGWVETQKIAILTGLNKTFAEAEEDNRRRIEAGDEVYELWHDGLNISSEDEDRALYAANHPFLPSTIVDQAMDNTDEILPASSPTSSTAASRCPGCSPMSAPRPRSCVGAVRGSSRWVVTATRSTRTA